MTKRSSKQPGIRKDHLLKSSKWTNDDDLFTAKHGSQKMVGCFQHAERKIIINLESKPSKIKNFQTNEKRELHSRNVLKGILQAEGK